MGRKQRPAGFELDGPEAVELASRRAPVPAAYAQVGGTCKVRGARIPGSARECSSPTKMSRDSGHVARQRDHNAIGHGTTKWAGIALWCGCGAECAFAGMVRTSRAARCAPQPAAGNGRRQRRVASKSWRMINSSSLLLRKRASSHRRRRRWIELARRIVRLCGR